MSEKYDITDAELEIMQVLWQQKQATLGEIIEKLEEKKPRNKNTVKTLLYRLVDKKAVKSKKANEKGFIYQTTITEKQFLARENKNFLQKLYQGSANKLLLNFVEEKTISKEELQKLMDLLEKEG